MKIGSIISLVSLLVICTTQMNQQILCILADNFQQRGLWGVKIQNISWGTIPADLPRSRKSVSIDF